MYNTSNIYLLILCAFISQSIADPFTSTYSPNSGLENLSQSSPPVIDFKDTICTDNGVTGLKCVKQFVENNVNTIIDNDSLITPDSQKSGLKDDSIDVSAYNESDGGLYNLQVLANKSDNIKSKNKNKKPEDIDDDEEFVYVDMLNGKLNTKKINGSVELEALLNMQGKSIIVPIYGTIHDYAYYFIKVYIGTPKSLKWVILDTGSSLFGLTCANCIQCGRHQNPNYEPFKSTSATKCADVKCRLKDCNECKFTQRYSEGSFISGDYYSDVISFNELSPNYYKLNNLGCILYENKLIYNQRADGIFGMSLNGHSVVSQLYKNSSIDKVFSICLSDEGGELIIGGINPKIFNINNKNGESSWTRLFNNNNYYINIDKMSFLSDDIQISNKKFSIDSGTTNTILMENMYNILVKRILDICSKDRDIQGYDLDIGVKVIQKKPDDIVDLIIEREENVTKCQVQNDEICSRNIDKFPPIHFTLESGDKLTINSDTYFFKRDSWWCLGIEKSKDGENIFGLNFFRNKQLIFTSDKLGFIPSACKSHSINI